MDKASKEYIQRALRERSEQSDFKEEARQAVKEAEDERAVEEVQKVGILQKIPIIQNILNAVKRIFSGQKALDSGTNFNNDKIKPTLRERINFKPDEDLLIFCNLKEKDIEELKKKNNIRDTDKVVTGYLDNKNPFIAWREEQMNGRMRTTLYHISSKDRDVKIGLPIGKTTIGKNFNYTENIENGISSGILELNHDSIKIVSWDGNFEKTITINREMGDEKERRQCTFKEVLDENGFTETIEENGKNYKIGMTRFYKDETKKQQPSVIQYCGDNYYLHDNGKYYKENDSESYSERYFERKFQLLSEIEKIRPEGVSIPEDIYKICEQVIQKNKKEAQNIDEIGY